MQLYPQQSEALDAMKRFVESETSVFILKGYAGTGKTTIIRAFSEMLMGYNRTPCLMAPTGRAAKVLSEKTGLNATTIHKAIYRKVIVDTVRYDENGNLVAPPLMANSESGIDDIDIYFAINQITDQEEAARMVIIVDEASMVSSKPGNQEVVHFGSDILIDDLLTFAQLPLGSKIVFVGDPAQLPPVGDNESCALNESFFTARGISVQSFALTDVIRQKGDNVILANAMKVRHLLDSTIRNELCFETKDGELEEISSVDVVDKFIEMYPTPGLNQSVVICFSNTQTDEYNRAIRRRYYTDSRLQVGDILQIVRNNYSVNTPEGLLLNGDFIRVLSVSDAVETHCVPVWVSKGSERTRINIDLCFQTIHFETDRKTEGVAKILTTLLQNNRSSVTREESVALYIDFVIRHPSLRRDSQDFVSAMLTDPYFNALQAKYGYAITGHKSQGGEWPTVFVDYTGRTGLDNDSLRWMYTATTRASQCLLGVNIPQITPFNKFSINPIQTVSKVQSEVISIKDLECPLLGTGATSAQKAKCNSIVEALKEIDCEVLSVACKPYRDRYTVQGPFGKKEYDCQYNGAGLYTSYSSLLPSESEVEVLERLRDERCYEYDYDYTPSQEFLERLRRVVVSAADEMGIKVTGIKEFPAQYYVLYGLRTSAPFASLQFYFNGKGFVTRAMAVSTLGEADEQLQKLINRIQELACLQ